MGCGSATPMRARSRAMPSSVICPSGRVSLIPGPTAGDPRWSAGGRFAWGRARASTSTVRCQVAPKSISVLDHPRQFAVGMPRLLERAPRGPVRRGRQQDALVVGPHRSAEDSDELDALGPVHALSPVPHHVDELHRSPRRYLHQLVGVQLAPHACRAQVVDRAGPAARAPRCGRRRPAGTGRPRPTTRPATDPAASAWPSSCSKLATRPSQPSSSHMFTTSGQRPVEPTVPHTPKQSWLRSLARHRAPVGRHVVHVLGAVVPDDVDELVDVDLVVRHASVTSAVSRGRVRGPLGAVVAVEAQLAAAQLADGEEVALVALAVPRAELDVACRGRRWWPASSGCAPCPPSPSGARGWRRWRCRGWRPGRCRRRGPRPRCAVLRPKRCSKRSIMAL